MKKKLSILLAGLGLCASMMMFNLETEAAKLKEGLGDCSFDGTDCATKDPGACGFCD